MPGDLIARLIDGTVPARPVGAARALVGAACVAKLGILFPTLARLGDPMVLRVPTSPWWPALPGAAVPALIGVWLTAGLAFALGWRTRVSGAVLAVALGIALLGDLQLYSNHLYLATTLVLLLTLADAGAALSLDARREGERPRVAAAPVLLLKLQPSIVYGFAALAKINLVYGSGAVLWAHLGRGSLVPFPEVLRRVEVLAPLALLSILVELALALGLWSRRWRGPTIGLGFTMHLGIVLALTPTLELVVFAALMFALYLLHLDAEPGSRVVVWDDACDFCGATVNRLRRLDWLAVHRFVGASTGALPPGVTEEAAAEALQLAGPDGVEAGFDGIRGILAVLPATFLIAPFLGIPPIPSLGRRAYRRVAVRRRCRLTGPAPPP